MVRIKRLVDKFEAGGGFNIVSGGARKMKDSDGWETKWNHGTQWIHDVSVESVVSNTNEPVAHNNIPFTKESKLLNPARTFLELKLPDAGKLLCAWVAVHFDCVFFSDVVWFHLSS